MTISRQMEIVIHALWKLPENFSKSQPKSNEWI